jgi:hypothetical protein
MSGVGLDRRFANFRLGLEARPAVDARERIRRSSAAAERLAAELDGELVRTPRGCYVRVEAPSTLLPLDRERLSRLPGQPPPGAPLLCLDTETTGLATAAGTLAFLVGLGWWEGSRFRQVQLLLPDHADEPALLAELSSHIAPDAWLVTYNGRGFDWPLLVARYRLARESPPLHAGHLDLLPLVRRVFRHRMPDARLGTVESVLLGLRRHADVGGWEIPARYLEFLRFGEPAALLEVVRHNDEDVRSLGRLLVHVDRGYADGDRWSEAPAGDLAGLARAFAGAGRHAEALACLEAAITGSRSQREARRPPDARLVLDAGGPPGGRNGPAAVRDTSPAVTYRSDPDDDGPWWSPRHRPDFGGRPGRYALPHSWPAPDPVRRDAPWTESRLLGERARLLRRLGRSRDAEAAWTELVAAGGTLAALAWIEVAKLREHQLRDPGGALEAASLAASVVERQARLGRPLPRLESALARRITRLRSRALRAQALATRVERRRIRRSTAPSSGTPDRPGPSIASDAAAAANRASDPRRGEPRVSGGSSLTPTIAARSTSPAPVGSTAPSEGIAP